jgi:hypothetical protein
MTMRDFDSILPRVMEKAPACPEPTAIRAIRDKAIEFCRRTRIWRFSDTITVSAADCEAIGAPVDSTIFEISDARFDTTQLKPVTVDWLDHNKSGWREDEEASPRYITQIAPGTVRVVPAEAGALKLQLILEPSDSARTLPAILVDRYAADLATGALGNILLIPGDFANPELAEDSRNDWKRMLDHYGVIVPKGQQKAPLRTRSSYF